MIEFTLLNTTGGSRQPLARARFFKSENSQGRFDVSGGHQDEFRPMFLTQWKNEEENDEENQDDEVKDDGNKQ